MGRKMLSLWIPYPPTHPRRHPHTPFNPTFKDVNFSIFLRQCFLFMSFHQCQCHVNVSVTFMIIIWKHYCVSIGKILSLWISYPPTHPLSYSHPTPSTQPSKMLIFQCFFNTYFICVMQSLNKCHLHNVYWRSWDINVTLQIERVHVNVTHLKTFIV